MIISRRHKRLPIKTRVVRRADEVPPEAWLDQFSFYYILAHRRNHLVGIAPCFFMDYPLDTSVSGPLRRVSNAIKRVLPNIFSLRAFVCGCPISCGTIAAREDPEGVFRAIARRIEQMAKKKRASVIGFKDFDRSYTTLLDKLQKSGYSKFDSLPNTELNVWFSGFEEYLKTLSAASRYDLRRKFRRVDGRANIHMEVTSSPDDKTLGAIYSLYRQTEAAHEMGLAGYEPKRRLGFDFVPLYLYVKHRNRLIRPLFKTFCQFLRFENFDPDLK
jgi:hypothetical protein